MSRQSRAAFFIVPITLTALFSPTLIARAGQDNTTPSPTYSQVVLNDHPIVYWRLGDQHSHWALDFSGNGRDAHFRNGPRLGLPGAIVNDPDTSVGFDGLDDYTVWKADSSYAGPFTVEAWAYPTKVAYGGRIYCSRRPGDYSFCFGLFIINKHKSLYMDVGDGAHWSFNGPMRYQYSWHAWHYIAVTVTATEATAYADGNVIGTVSYGATTPLLFDSTHWPQLGHFYRPSTNENFKGRIDEVALYDYALTDEQIATHYAAGINARG